MATFRDHFSAHADEYRVYRPTYPPELFAYLAAAAPARDLAWDCGTGNGQAALGLAEHFARVVATDGSAKQIAEARPHPRVEYAVTPAEECPLPDRTADLVTVAQALHWFDLDAFYAEVRRVSRPGGLLAVTCYCAPSAGPDVDEVLRRYQDLVRTSWPPGREWVDAGYRTIAFPFPELPAPHFDLTVDADLAWFLGYLGTWSATKEFTKARGFDPVAQLRGEFAAVWGDPAAVRAVRWEFNVRVGRVTP